MPRGSSSTASAAPTDAALSAPTLIIGIGNPSRGDDALGPLAIERLEAMRPAGVELLTDFQLQVEHALDLRDRQQVYFVDASVGCAEPYALEPVGPGEDRSISSHVLSPRAVLEVYRRLFGAPPAAQVLAIRGYAFELGEGLSAGAARNLEAALAALSGLLRR